MIFNSNGGTDKSKGLTATANDIVKDKTALVDGEVITGSVDVQSSGHNVITAYPIQSNDDIYVLCDLKKDILLKSGVILGAYTHISNFGDATAADVTAGKTFTSAAGLKVTGTYSSGLVFEEVAGEGNLDSDSNTLSITITDTNTIYKINEILDSGHGRLYGFGYMTLGVITRGSEYMTALRIGLYDGEWEASGVRGGNATVGRGASCSYDRSTNTLTITLSGSEYYFCEGKWWVLTAFTE